MVHKSIRESRELLYELKITEAATPSVATVWGEGSSSHRALVAELSALTTGSLVPSTQKEGRLIRDENIDTGGKYDTFEKALEVLKSKLPQFTITKWDKSNPKPKSGSVGSGSYPCFRVDVKNGTATPTLADGVYVVPYIPLVNEKTGKSFLETDKMLGYGAEWAVWLALGGKPPSSLEESLEGDARLKDFFTNKEPQSVASVAFVSKIESMRDTLKDNLGPLVGYSTEGEKLPRGGPDRVDITAKNPDGVEISISVKYGRTERLGSATQVKTSGSSANIFQSVSKYANQEETNKKTWRKIGKDETQGEGGRDWIKPELVTVQNALDKGTATFEESKGNAQAQANEWYKALVSEARKWLGLPAAVTDTGTSEKYVIVQFPSVNDVKVTKPEGGSGWKIQVKRGEGEVFKRAYVISVKKGDGKVIDDVLEVELRFTGRKYTQWSKGDGWATFIKDQEILRNNAKVQGQSLADARLIKLVKPINETRDLLERLFEE